MPVRGGDAQSAVPAYGAATTASIFQMREDFTVRPRDKQLSTTKTILVFFLSNLLEISPSLAAKLGRGALWPWLGMKEA
jgi:hypothetical protein